MVTKMKSVLITGCSAGGIGPALAHAFHQKGYHVFATARTPSKIPTALSGAPNVTVLNLDVLSPDSIAGAVETVRAQTGGRLDVLVNNSGTNIIKPALDVGVEEAKEVFDLNFWAPLAMLQAFAPLLIEARGCLVNNTSANAVAPMPLMSASLSPPLTSPSGAY
jgi:NAD(P)-dependent dehydrogenase (short-subunit alcohol dehydrogenase family)